MKGSLAGRVRRVISGSFNAIVNAVENAAPEVVMEEAIREVEGVIEDVRSELGKAIANKHLANTRLMQANQKHADLGQKIELAVKQNRDDLAEAAISQQLDIEAQMPILETQITDLGSQEKELEGFISALQGKRREMQEELRLFRESRQKAKGEAGTGSASVVAGNVAHESTVSRAESAFERVLGKTTGMGSIISTDRKTAAKLTELEDLARKNRIQERLAALKNRARE